MYIFEIVADDDDDILMLMMVVIMMIANMPGFALMVLVKGGKSDETLALKLRLAFLLTILQTILLEISLSIMAKGK